MKFNLNILINIIFLVFAVRFAAKILYCMRAKRAENFDLLTFAPPPPPSEKRIDAPAYDGAIYTIILTRH